MKYILTVGLFFMSICLFAQLKHTVEPKETYYSITKKYNITEAQLLDANTFLKTRGLQPGDVLTIPSKNATNSTEYVISGTTKVVKEEAGFYYLKIGEKETIYNLTKKYKTTEDIIKKYNPNVAEKGLIVGELIKIPGKSPEKISEEIQPAQNTKPVPKETKIIAEDDEYVSFAIGNDETLETFSQKYDLSIRTIVKNNEFLEGKNLTLGDVVKIPNTKKLQAVLQAQKEIANQTKTTKVLSENDEFYFIETGKNETLETVAEKFHSSVKAIKDNNSFLGNDAIQEGFTLKIPKKTAQFTQEKKIETDRQKDDTIHIVYFLPFNLKSKQKSGEKIASTNFLSGCKFALDSLMHQGKKLKVKMFDISSDDDLNKAFASYDFSKTDLVIGPFKNAILDNAAQKLSEWNTPILSPLSTQQNLKAYKNVILGQTDEKLLVDALVNEIKDKYRNQVIYLYAKTDELELLEYAKVVLQEAGISASNITITHLASDIVIPQNVMTEKYQAIIPVLLSEDKNFCNEFLNKLGELDGNLVSPFALHYFKAYESLTNVQKLQKTGFTYIYNEKATIYESNTAKTLKLFEKKYCDAPDRYAVQGFDITYDIISRMDNSGNLINLNAVNHHIAYKYQYEESSEGASFNKAYSITKIEKNTN